MIGITNCISNLRRNNPILSSSAAEPSTVNRLVVGSNPTWGVTDWYTSVLASPREKRIGNPTHAGERWDPSWCPSVLFCRISLTLYLRGVAQFGRALALGASGRRFKSFHPDCIHTTTMHFYSVEYWQENWETLMDRVENGETIGVENDKGERAVMVPADDELIRMYTDHSEGS